MRQRALIAMALACRPRLLIADEPTTALDVTIQAQILELLKRAGRASTGTALIMITHDLGVVAGLCDRVNVHVRGADRRGAPTGTSCSPSPGTRTPTGLLGSMPRLDSPTRASRCDADPRVRAADTLPWDAGLRVRARAARPARRGVPAARPRGTRTTARAARSLRCHNPVRDARPTGCRTGLADHARPGVGAPSGGRRPTRRGERTDLLVRPRASKVHFPIRSGIVCRPHGRPGARPSTGSTSTSRAAETYGLVGESGCGKSTLGRALLRLEEPTAGTSSSTAWTCRRCSGEALRRRAAGCRWSSRTRCRQLDPRQNVESILAEPLQGARHRRGRGRRTRRGCGSCSTSVGLPASAVARYPHEFSGGQRQRIGIARAIALEPELIVADEPVSALDVSIQAQVVNLLEELQERLGLTYLVIAHDLAVVRHISDAVGVMYLGGIVEQASARRALRRAAAPVHEGADVGGADPGPGRWRTPGERILLTGDLPSPANPPSGCRFHTRCPWGQETRCADERPGAAGGPARPRVACHWPRRSTPARSARARRPSSAEGRLRRSGPRKPGRGGRARRRTLAGMSEAAVGITRDEVAHLARLARLAVTDEELDLFAGQLDVILRRGGPGR